MADFRGPNTSAGWDVGVRQAVAADRKTVWAFLMGEGLPLWLGKTTKLPLVKGAAYETDDDITGRVLSVQPGVDLRVSWRPGEWNHDSTLQLSLKEAGGVTTISFHQQKLTSRDERKMMLGRWKGVASDLEKALKRKAK
jgi:uncharacterized protein YndB with AHSA1/START domain